MKNVSRILDRLEDDAPEAVRELFVAVYDELRELAARHLQSEQPGQTLQATALVHEALDQALLKFHLIDPTACELVKLRYFAGLSQRDAGRVLNIARRTADRLWVYAKAWLRREIQ